MLAIWKEAGRRLDACRRATPSSCCSASSWRTTTIDGRPRAQDARAQPTGRGAQSPRARGPVEFQVHHPGQVLDRVQGPGGRNRPGATALSGRADRQLPDRHGHAERPRQRQGRHGAGARRAARAWAWKRPPPSMWMAPMSAARRSRTARDRKAASCAAPPRPRRIAARCSPSRPSMSTSRSAYAVCPAGQRSSNCSRLEGAEHRQGGLPHRVEQHGLRGLPAARAMCQRRPGPPHLRGGRAALAAAGAPPGNADRRRSRQEMRQRNGIEGTQSELVRGYGLRQARYRGLAKVRLQNYLIGAACNIRRLFRRMQWESAQACPKTAALVG